MKYVVVVADGMPDYANPELDGKTPIEQAFTPNIDALARKGQLGLVKTIPEGYPPGSDVANLSVLGYDPQKYYTGRSPFETVSMGIDLGPEDVAFRCNFVTLSHDKKYGDKKMLDYSAGEISTEEARELIALVESKLANSNCSFYPGISYRHAMVWRQGRDKLNLTPPHDIHNKTIKDYLPQGDEAALLLELMEKSSSILADAPVNKKREKLGQNPANSIWLWGEGKKPALSSFKEKYDLEGVVISAVDLIKGLGKCAGLKVIEIEGATGNLHTNFQGKAEGALEALANGSDFAFIHIEAPDEASHQGSLKDKITAIEKIDAKIVGPVSKELEKHEDYKIMILADHYTPLSLRTHSTEEVPFLIYHKSKNKQGAKEFNEKTAREAGLYFQEGYRLMDYLLQEPGLK